MTKNFWAFMAIMALAIGMTSCCSEIKLVNGNYKALRESTGTAQFVLDLSNTKAVEYRDNPFAKETHQLTATIGTIDERNQKAGDDYVRDWHAVREQMTRSFMNRFNRSLGKKGITLTMDKATTPYQVVFHVKYLDFGNTGVNIASGVVESIFGSGSFYGGGAGGCLCEGTVELIDTRNGQVLGTIDIRPVKEDGSPSETVRLCRLMEYCGKWSGRRAKK